MTPGESRLADPFESVSSEALGDMTGIVASRWVRTDQESDTTAEMT